MIRSFAINARFLTRPASGVDRVASELVCALAARADVDHLVLLHPPTERLFADWLELMPVAASKKVQVQALGRRTGHAWEQLDLVGASPGLTLLSLCNTGPALRRNQVLMIHDAQVWDSPHGLPLGFRVGYRTALPILARTARHVVTVSHFAKTRLEARRIAPVGKVQVVLNGADHMQRVAADPHALLRHGLEAGRYLLAVGSRAPHKNLPMLIHAAVSRGPGAPELILVGDMTSRLFGRAELPDAEGVRLIGRVSDGALKALYQGALALALPSTTEGFGLPALEAMACGCPVIAARAGALPEICGDAALFVDPMDLAGWTSAMERVVQDGDCRAALITKGTARAAQYSWARAAAGLMAGIAASGYEARHGE